MIHPATSWVLSRLETDTKNVGLPVRCSRDQAGAGSDVSWSSTFSLGKGPRVLVAKLVAIVRILQHTTNCRGEPLEFLHRGSLRHRFFRRTLGYRPVSLDQHLPWSFVAEDCSNIASPGNLSVPEEQRSVGQIWWRLHGLMVPTGPLGRKKGRPLTPQPHLPYREWLSSTMSRNEEGAGSSLHKKTEPGTTKQSGNQDLSGQKPHRDTNISLRAGCISTSADSPGYLILFAGEFDVLFLVYRYVTCSTYRRNSRTASDQMVETSRGVAAEGERVGRVV